MFTWPIYGSWGISQGPGPPPTVPTLTLTDKEDGTGFVAALSGYDSDSTNTLYVGRVDEEFTSKGSTWDSNDEIVVSAIVARWFAYVVSCNTHSCVVTAVEPVIVTGGAPVGADDNVPVAVRAMKQLAVYWAPLDEDEYGQPTFASPVQIAVRWEDAVEEFINPNGDKEMSRAKLIVDRDLDNKGYLWLGNIVDLVSDTPAENDDAWEIRLFKKTPNFRGNKFLREVYL